MLKFMAWLPKVMFSLRKTSACGERQLWPGSGSSSSRSCAPRSAGPNSTSSQVPTTLRDGDLSGGVSRGVLRGIAQAHTRHRTHTSSRAAIPSSLQQALYLRASALAGTSAVHPVLRNSPRHLSPRLTLALLALTTP
uniref:Putative secreted protein n=1 Tax=Ixodes ricinus TaxID=34613 RepID=A0A6B0USH6_IXORI